MINIQMNVFYDSDVPGNGDATFLVSVPCAILTELYFADENKQLLSGYTAIKAFPLPGGNGSWHAAGSYLIPEDAAYYYFRLWDDGMNELHFPEQFVLIPPEKRRAAAKPKHRARILSDIHVGGEYFHNTECRQKTLDFAKKLPADFTIMSGDITDNSWPEEYERAQAMLQDMIGNTPIAVCTGNHDISPYMAGSFPHYEALDAFFSWQTEYDRNCGCPVGDLTDYRFETNFAGYPVFVLNANREHNRTVLGQEQLEWLEENLKKTDGQGIWRFIVIHTPMAGTVEDSTFDELLDAAPLRKIIHHHRHIIHCSGHSHYSFDSDLHSVTFDSEHQALYINGGCAVWSNRNLTARHEYYQQYRGTGQLLEIYEDCLITRGFDGVSGRFIPRAQHLFYLEEK